MTKYRIPTLEIIFFGVENNRAILITKELEGFQSLEDLNWDALNRYERTSLLKETAKVIAKMNNHRLQHNALYPKHIFAKPMENSWDIRIIDLEKTKRRLFKITAILRDLGSLHRHSLDWTIRDKITFFKTYVNETKLSPKSKKLWKKIQNHALKKSK